MCVWGGGGGGGVVVAKVITISYYISKEVSKRVGVLHPVNHCGYTSGRFGEREQKRKLLSHEVRNVLGKHVHKFGAVYEDCMIKDK